MRHLNVALLALSCAYLTAGCRGKGFEPASFTSIDALFSASLRQFERKKWSDAARGFDKLTNDLPARDARLPAAYFYLGKSQQKMGDMLTAARTFQRISDGFPDDSLADDALLEGGQSYQKLWRKPALDSEHGQSALNLYQTLLVVYPDSRLKPAAEGGIANIEQWLAVKDYDTGYHYMRRGAYDSAIIYFKDVIRRFPRAPKTRETYLRLLESYRSIRYRDDARELCATMLQTYASDREVTRACRDAG